MPEQKKKNPNDPNVDQINQEIVALARHHAFLRGPFILFLEGHFTWLEALESMVILMTKEYRAQNKILIETLEEVGPQITDKRAAESKQNLMLTNESVHAAT